jgi:hypothetical protein
VISRLRMGKSLTFFTVYALCKVYSRPLNGVLAWPKGHSPKYLSEGGGDGGGGGEAVN